MSSLLYSPLYKHSPVGLRLAPPERVRLVGAAFKVPPRLEVVDHSTVPEGLPVFRTDIRRLQDGYFFNPHTQHYDFFLHYPNAKTVSVCIGGGVDSEEKWKSLVAQSEKQHRNTVSMIAPQLNNPLKLTEFIHEEDEAGERLEKEAVDSKREDSAVSLRGKSVLYWTGSVYFPVGLTTFSILLNENDVLSPFLPITVNRCRPSHFVDRPPVELVSVALEVDQYFHPERQTPPPPPHSTGKEVARIAVPPPPQTEDPLLDAETLQSLPGALKEKVEHLYDQHDYLLQAHLPPLERGNIVEEWIPCRIAGGALQRLLVYLPSGYLGPPQPGTVLKDYPVLYLQHGVGGNENQWSYFGRVQHILDNMLYHKKCKEMIVVMGDGMLSVPLPLPEAEKRDPALSTTVWANKNPHTASVIPQHDQLYYIDFLVKDVIPFIDQKYRTVYRTDPTRRRAVAGFSMGSWQAAVLGMAYSDLFQDVGVLSGFLRSHYLANLLGGQDTHLDRFLEFMRKKEEATVSAGGAPPPKKEWALEYFKHVLHNHTFFRVMGEEDPFFPLFLQDDEFLTQLGIETTDNDIIQRRTYPGSVHSWECMRRALPDFLKLIFKE